MKFSNSGWLSVVNVIVVLCLQTIVASSSSTNDTPSTLFSSTGTVSTSTTTTSLSSSSASPTTTTDMTSSTRATSTTQELTSESMTSEAFQTSEPSLVSTSDPDPLTTTTSVDVTSGGITTSSTTTILSLTSATPEATSQTSLVLSSTSITDIGSTLTMTTPKADSGLSGGDIVAVVVCTLIGAAILVMIVVKLVRQHIASRSSAHYENFDLSQQTWPT